MTKFQQSLAPEHADHKLIRKASGHSLVVHKSSDLCLRHRDSVASFVSTQKEPEAPTEPYHFRLSDNLLPDMQPQNVTHWLSSQDSRVEKAINTPLLEYALSDFPNDDKHGQSGLPGDSSANESVYFVQIELKVDEGLQGRFPDTPAIPVTPIALHKSEYFYMVKQMIRAVVQKVVQHVQSTSGFDFHRTIHNGVVAQPVVLWADIPEANRPELTPLICEASSWSRIAQMMHNRSHMDVLFVTFTIKEDDLENREAEWMQAGFRVE